MDRKSEITFAEHLLEEIIKRQGMCKTFRTCPTSCPLINFCGNLPLLLDGGKSNGIKILKQAKEKLQAIRKLKWLEEL